ncbi:hypothetical protein X801_07845, partial [Opisthorchis viverrini]
METLEPEKYYVELELGENKQKFKLLVDTGSDVLWVPSTRCAQGHWVANNKFDHFASSTFTPTTSMFSVQYATGNVAGIIGKDTVW